MIIEKRTYTFHPGKRRNSSPCMRPKGWHCIPNI